MHHQESKQSQWGDLQQSLNQEDQLLVEVNVVPGCQGMVEKWASGWNKAERRQIRPRSARDLAGTDPLPLIGQDEVLTQG